jgi:hypothetical protein
LKSLQFVQKQYNIDHTAQALLIPTFGAFATN